MAKGRRISEQRESARRTIRDRDSGSNRASEGSTFRDSARARENRERQKKIAEAKKLNVKEAQAEQKARLSAGASPEQQQANLEGFQEGFTNETVTEAFGDIAGSVTGGVGKTVVEGVSKISDFFGGGDVDEGDTFQRRGFQRFGEKVADETGLTGSSIANTALDVAAKSNPVSALGKAALDFNKRTKTTIKGPGGTDQPAFTGEAGAPAGGRRGRGEDINPDDSGFGTALTPTPTPPTTSISSSKPTVSITSANPGIGISSGTDERVPNFTGSIVVSGRKSRKRRGIT